MGLLGRHLYLWVNTQPPTGDQTCRAKQRAEQFGDIMMSLGGLSKEQAIFPHVLVRCRHSFRDFSPKKFSHQVASEHCILQDVRAGELFTQR